MKRLAAALLGIGVLLDAGGASAEKLILAVSAETVKISSNFTGTGITVFGAIERDGTTISRNAVYDVVIVMLGPSETLVTRRKDRVAGIWLNSASRTFLDMPSFYAVNSTRPLDEIATPVQLKRFQIGIDNLAFRSPSGELPDSVENQAFREAFARLKRDAGLYVEAPYGIVFPGSFAFKTSIEIPANVPTGLYRVSAYLFSDDALVATNNTAINIAKTGFEQWTFDLARQNGFLYGIACVLLALLTGWLAGVLFRRD